MNNCGSAQDGAQRLKGAKYDKTQMVCGDWCAGGTSVRFRRETYPHSL
jgi:hypothetical protein